MSEKKYIALDWISKEFLDTARSEVVKSTLAAINRLLALLTNNKATPKDLAGLKKIVEQKNLILVTADDLGITIELMDERTGESNIVGMGIIHWEELLDKCNAYIDDVVVLKSHRGHHIAERIMNALIDVARSVGANHIDLTSGKGEDRAAANHLYQKLGFKLRNEETNVYRLTL